MFDLELSSALSPLIFCIAMLSGFGFIRSALQVRDELKRVSASPALQGRDVLDLEHLFKHIARPNINISVTLCTLLGLFGTFWGMSEGLSGIDTSELKQIEAGAKTLIGGMSTAFSTSLVGVLCSIILMGLQGVTYRYLDWFERSVRHQITTLHSSRIISPLQLLSYIAQAQNAQDSEKMSAAVQALSKAASGFNLEALGVQIGASLERSIKEHMMPPLMRVADEVKELRASHEEQREEMLRSVIRALQDEVFEPMSQNISALADQLQVSDQNTQKLIEAVQIVARDIHSVNDQVNQSLTAMQETQEKTIRAMGVFLRKLNEELQRTEETIRETTTSSLRLLEEQQTTFKETAYEAAQMLTQVREDTRQMLEEGVRQVAQQASEILIQARREVEEGLRSVPEMLTKTREETQEQLTAFRVEYQERLQAFFDRQSEILNEVLGSQKDALAEVVLSLKAAFEDEYTRRRELGVETGAHLETLSASTKLLDALNTSLSAQSATMLPKIAEASQGVAGQLQTLHQMYADTNQTFSSSAERFGHEVTRVISGLQDRQDVLFQTQDEELSKIFTHLVQVVTLLNQTASEVRSALQVARYDR